MRRAAGITALALFAGISVYLSWAYPRLPAAVPVRWNMASMPVTRETFVGIPAGVTVLFFALALAAARTRPKAAWLATLALGVVFLFVHVRVQAVLEAFLPIPENVAVALAVAAAALCVTCVFLFPRRPPPKRVQPF